MSNGKSILVVSHACTRAVNRAPYEEMARLGWKVTIVTVATLNEAGRVAPADPIDPDGPVVHLVRRIGDNARLQRYEGLAQIIKTVSPDWVIADIDPHSLLAVELAGRKRRNGYQLGFISCENLAFGIRALWTRRGWRGALLGAFCTTVRWWVRPRTDLVFAINLAGTRLFQQAGFSRVLRTPLGYPDRHFRINNSARKQIRNALQLTGPVIAYFGRLSPEKGVHVLLDALDCVMDLQWQFLLDDFQAVTSYQTALKQKIDSAAWAQRAKYIHASHGAVADYMNAADLVIVPSITTNQWEEQYGRVVPEALACGCSVIASNVGAIPELINGHGNLVPQGSVLELANAIRSKLTQDRVLIRSDENAEYARANFSARAQAALWNAELQ